MVGIMLGDGICQPSMSELVEGQGNLEVDSPVGRLLCRANRQMMRSMGAQVASKDTRAMIAPTGHDMVIKGVALLYNVFGCHSWGWFCTHAVRI